MSNNQNLPEINAEPVPGLSTYFRHKNQFCLENCWYCDNPEVKPNKRFIPSSHYSKMIEDKKKENNE